MRIRRRTRVRVKLRLRTWVRRRQSRRVRLISAALATGFLGKRLPIHWLLLVAWRWRWVLAGLLLLLLAWWRRGQLLLRIRIAIRLWW